MMDEPYVRVAGKLGSIDVTLMVFGLGLVIMLAMVCSRLTRIAKALDRAHPPAPAAAKEAPDAR